MTIHRYLGAQIHPEDRESTEEITTSGISSYGWQGRWLVTMSSVVAKKTSGRMEQLRVILIQLPISQTRLLPQFARFTVIAKAAPGRRCSSRHSLTREELSLRGRIVFCLESLKASLPFQAPLSSNGRRPFWRNWAEVDPSYDHCSWSGCVACLSAICCVSNITKVFYYLLLTCLSDLFGSKRNYSQPPCIYHN
jgi:hypothetical protein